MKMRQKTNNYSVLLILTVLIFASGCLTNWQKARETSRQDQDPLHGGSQASSDAELLIKAMRDIHPGYIRYRSETDASVAEQDLRKAVKESHDVASFYLAVSEFLAKIRCEHTEAELPVAFAEWRDVKATMLPVSFVLVQDTAIIVGVAPGITSIQNGDELLEVDGHSMRKLFTDMAKYISVDGFTDHTKATLFSGSDDIGLTTFDIFYPLLHGFRDSFLLTVRSPGGERRVIQVPAVDERASLAARGLSEAQADFSDEGAVSWQRRGAIAVLSIRTFVNYRNPVEPDEVFGPIFNQINKSDQDLLVLDLRNVGGGSTDVMVSLIRHLIDRSINLGGSSRVRTYEFEAYREHLSTWDESVFNMPASLFTPHGSGMYTVSPEVDGEIRRVEPAPEAWRGSLTVLIGPGNESGATILLAELRDQRKMTLVGQPTGGSAEGPTAGVIAYLLLPASKIVVRVPLLWTTTSFKRFEYGQGIEPDVIVPLTIEDVRAGRDRTLYLATGGK